MDVQVISKIAGGDPPAEKHAYKKVFYTGTDTLYNGYVVCYDRDAGTAANAEWNRASWVEKPASGNLDNFAGFVVGLGGAGRAGPGLFKIVDKRVRQIGVAYGQGAIGIGVPVYIRADSYYVWAAFGTTVGTARQTTTAAGEILVENESSPSTPIMSAYGALAGEGPSYALWEDCPWLEMLLNPTLGTTYFNDFVGGFQPITGTSTTEVEDWIQTEVTSGLTQYLADGGSVLRVSSEAYASADDGITVMWRATTWVTEDTKTLWFEARVKMTDIDTTPDQFFVGLCNTLTSMLPSGVIDDTVDKIGFYSHSGTTAATLEFITSKTAVQAQTTGAATGLSDGTYVKLGFKVTWSSSVQTVTPYVNGVAGTAHATALSVPTAGTGLGICLAACVDQTSALAALDVDWIRIAQLR